VELGKSKETLKIDNGGTTTNGTSSVVSPNHMNESISISSTHSVVSTDNSSVPGSPPTSTINDSHYHHHNNVLSNHSNPPSPIPSNVTAPSSFPSNNKKSLKSPGTPVPDADKDKHQISSRPLSRKSFSAVTPPPGSNYVLKENEFGKNFKILPVSDQIRELQTIIRDKNTTRSDFKFYADRLIRLVIEESLNLLPFRPRQVVTPTGATYDGLKYERGNCGVSIVRYYY